MANQSLVFDFGSRGADTLGRDLKSTADNSVLAAKGARLLADSLERERKAAQASAAATLAAAKADKILADAEDDAIAKSVEERIALEKAAAAKHKDAEAARRDAEETKKAAAAHERLIGRLANAGKVLGAGGLFAGGAGVLSLAGPLAGLGAAVGAFGAVAVPELAKIQQAMAKTGKARQTAFAAFTPAEKKLAGDFKDLKDQFHGIEASLAPVIDQVVKVASAFLKDLVPAFKILATVGGNTLETILGYMGQFLRSPAFTVLAKQLGQLASQVAPLLGRQLVALLKVFLQLFVQVGPAGIKLLRALLPALVEIVADLTPVIVILADVVAASLQWLQVNHLLIPALAILGAALITWLIAVEGASAPILLVVAAVAAVVVGVVELVKHWGTVWAFIKRVSADAWHWLYDNVFAKLIVFFTKTIPAVADIFKETIRIAWDDIKITFLKGVAFILNIMGKLPGPLGAPFRKAHADIAGELKGIQGDVAKAARNIQGDWDRIHGRTVGVTWQLHLPPGLPGIRAGGAPTRTAARGVQGAQAGTWLVGEEGPELAYLPHGTTVVPAAPTARILGGLAAGTSGWNFTDRFAPSLGVYGQRVAALGASITSAVVNAGNRLIDRSLSRLTFPAAAGPGGGAPGANAALARRMMPAWGTGAMWAAWNALAMGESGWSQYARNPSSGAYGIPQALPPGKMGPAANPPQSNPAAQIAWMIGYIRSTYGNPIAAYNLWSSRSPHWYDHGGYLPTGLSLAYNGTGRPEQVIPGRGRAGGVTYNISVNVPVSANKADIGRQIVDSIRQFEMRSGAGWRR